MDRGPKTDFSWIEKWRQRWRQRLRVSKYIMLAGSLKKFPIPRKINILILEKAPLQSMFPFPARCMKGQDIYALPSKAKFVFEL